LKLKLASGGSGSDSQVKQIHGRSLVVQKLSGLDVKNLRTVVDQWKQKIGQGVVLLGSVDEDHKVTLVVGVTDDLTAHVKAGELAGFIAAQVGGKGGGRADFAQAGGPLGAQLDSALASVDAWLAQKLGS